MVCTSLFYSPNSLGWILLAHNHDCTITWNSNTILVWVRLLHPLSPPFKGTGYSGQHPGAVAVNQCYGHRYWLDQAFLCGSASTQPQVLGKSCNISEPPFPQRWKRTLKSCYEVGQGDGSALWVLTTKPDNLSWMPGPPWWGEKMTPASCSLISTCRRWYNPSPIKKYMYLKTIFQKEP